MENQINKFNNILFFIAFFLYHKDLKLEVGNHIIAIYDTGQEKFNEAFEFLTQGLARNEVAMLITEELTKREITDILKRILKFKILKN